MCLTCVSSYRPLINAPPSLGNLLLDITLFNFIPVSFSFFVILGSGLGLGSVVGLGLGLGLGFGFGIGNLKNI